jgi:hypothetical protein
VGDVWLGDVVFMMIGVVEAGHIYFQISAGSALADNTPESLHE